MNAEIVPPPWEVLFDGNFQGQHDSDSAGTEIHVYQEFQFAGRQLIVPAVYSCGKGLVADICMRADPENIRAFMEKWNMTFANEREHPFTREDHIKWKIDNPFDLDFHAKAILNGEELPPSRVCGAGYNPCVPESFADELEGKRAVDHYGLDPSCGWMIWRCSFPWKTKKHPSIKSLSLSLHPEPVPIPGPHFRVSAPGDSFSFTHPETGVVHTLTVVEYEKQTMNLSRMPKQDVEYPPHYTAMSYIVSPELSQEELTLSDCAGSDQPRAKPTPEENMFLPSSKSAIGVIGGGDGPVVFMMRTLSKEKTASVCSSLHFEPVEDVEWRITFRVNRFEEKTVELIS